MGTHVSRNALLLAMSEILSSLISIPMKLRMKRIPSFRILLGIISIGPLLLLFVTIPLDCFQTSYGQYKGLCWQEAVTMFVAIVIIIFLNIIDA